MRREGHEVQAGRFSRIRACHVTLTAVSRTFFRYCYREVRAPRLLAPCVATGASICAGGRLTEGLRDAFRPWHSLGRPVFGVAILEKMRPE